MSDRTRLRLVVLRVLVVSLLLTLLGRLWYLQVLAAPEYQRAAADNQVRDIVASAPRGEILDDRGRAFARNRTALVVSVDRIALQRQRDGGSAVLHRLSRVLHIRYGDLRDRITLCGAHALPEGCWNGSPYEPIPVTQLKHDVHSTRLALQILERKEDFPGVSAALAAVRSYVKPKGAYATHLLGNLAPITAEELKRLPKSQQDARRRDLVGRQGLEQQYDRWLRGDPGVTQVAVDHLGAVTGTLKETPPTPGDNLVTSLDANVQAALEKSLAGAVHHARELGVHAYGGPADFGAGVVLDARTGHVVAMASYPSYDPSLWDGGRIDTRAYDRLRAEKGSPLVDKAFSSAYSPGSSFKPISTSGLLHDGTASLSGAYPCGPSYSVGGRSFRNFEGESGGTINLHQTLVISCDTVYYYLAYHDWLRDEALVAKHKKPVEGVQKVARDYGIGMPPGVDLPNATTGHIADRRNTLLQWRETHRDYCIGAKRRSPSDPLKAFDKEYCTDGWRFNAGLQLIEDIGQGSVLVSPLQLAVAYAAVANGGTVFEPRVGKAIVDASGHVVKRLRAPVRGHVPLTKAQLDYIRNALYDVTTQGTGATAFAGWPQEKFRIGGKTGTAELGISRSYTSAWFASFGGKTGEKPQFVTVMMIDKGGVGGVVAAPAVREVWDAVFGVDGHKAAFPTGHPPAALPRLHATQLPGSAADVGSDGAKNRALPDLGLPPALAVGRYGRPTLAGQR
ncbi:MAG TPA: penicillin-binding transpeptidase domain-containing protein [Mycobacteriales bacterium]|nr:penicillin-binding transpeptidase domain-containing protein [Mycobacteriales bacterium]